MDRIYQCDFRLSRLRNIIEQAIFAVPELQREFVWGARKACDLLDSIFRNYPIGTIVVWKTNRRNENQLRTRLHILPHFDRSNEHIYFLIDGQQRLSVLWHFLKGEADSVKNAGGREVDFGKVYFNPHAKNGESPFLYRTKIAGELAMQVVRVVDVLSDKWRARALRGRGPRVRKRIEECRKRILQYAALFVFCETNDLAEVRESFIRINSQGMLIGAADRAFARATKFNMRAMVRDVQSRLGHGFDRMSSQVVLQTIAMALGIRDVGERAISALITRLESNENERERFDRAWPALREAFGLAIDYFVYRLGVPSYDFLPSEPMITTLTLYFFHNRNRRPSKAARRRLKKWFWATAVGARYTGRGYRPNVQTDAEFSTRLASNPNAQFPCRVSVPLHVLATTEYGRPGPLSNAFFCLLRQQGPRYLEDGVEIPLGEISTRRDRRDKHHIFPKALLSRHDVARDRADSILNICYLVARENQVIGQRTPRYYFAEVPRTKRARAQALRSHLIPSHDGKGIWDASIRRGFRQLLNDRGRLVARALEANAGMRLFERG